MDQIKLHVSGGLLKPGDPLPSTRALSAELGVNPMTVSKAYSYLEKEAVLERRPGLPLVVRSLPEGELESDRLEQLRRSLTPSITVIRQLGIEADVATRVLGELLDGKES